MILPLIASMFLVAPTDSSEYNNINIQTANTVTGTINVTTYSSPDSSYAILTQHLNSAQSKLDIMIYSISNGYILALLNDIMERNPSIEMNVIVSYHHASYYEGVYTTGALYNLSQAANKYGATNINLYESSNTFDFTHAKFVVIDEQTVLVQSANWAGTGVPVKTTYGNREWGIVINNTDIADEFLSVFNSDLLIASPYSPQASDEYNFGSSTPGGSYPVNFAAKNIISQMSITPIFSPNDSQDALLDLINSANETLEIQQAYIKYDWDGSINPLLPAIVNAANRGVDVRIIVQEPTSSTNNESVNYFLNHSIPVAFSNSTYFKYCHNKGVIVDGKIVFISSINWSFTSVNENREAGVIIENQEVANFYLQIFNYDWSVAEQLNPTTTPDAIEIPIEIIAIGGIIGVILASLVAIFAKKTHK